jgi:sensor histidine kinase YesM
MQSIPHIVAPINFLRNRTLTHILFWLVVLGSLILGLVNQNIDSFWRKMTTLEFIFYVTFSYPIILIFIPKILYQKKLWHFLLVSTIWIIFVAYWANYSLIRIASTYELYKLLAKEATLFSQIPIYILFFFLVSAIKIGKDLLLVQYNSAISEKQKTQQELKFLKSQLSPHFLLNTMNNLYGLAVTKSDELPALILRLSDLLRFTIYDSKDDMVLVKDEIQYLKDYIELQKIRMNSQKNLKVSFPEVNNNLKMVPLILVVFIENAFKHSQEMTSKDKVFLEFKIEIKDSYLYFLCENCYEDHDINISPNTHVLEKEGVGLENTLRRIELLCGAESMPIIEKANGKFSVRIKLKLHE